MTAVGIDACKSGWIAVAVRPERDAEAHYLATIDDLASAIPDASVAAIDIPIGLPGTGRRQSDIEARAFLGVRRNSLFFAPVREALLAPTHAEATALSLRLTGAGISHAPASATKKSWAGMLERRAVLAEAGIALENSSSAASARAGVDDMLDAGAAAWSALRLLGGTARSLPEPPELDSHGRQMAIWF